MGIGTLALVAVGISAAATTGKIISEKSQQAAQEDAIMTREAQERVAAAQRGLNRVQQLNRVIGKAEALAGARGGFASSPSFASLIDKSFQNFEQDERADALNLSFREGFLKQQARAQKSASEARIFGDVGSFATSFASRDPFNLFANQQKG